MHLTSSAYSGLHQGFIHALEARVAGDAKHIDELNQRVGQLKEQVRLLQAERAARPRLTARPDPPPRSADATDVGRVGPLRTLGDLELDLVVFLEVAVTGPFNRAEVHEYVGATLLRDETEALLGVEPLHGATSHKQSLLSWPCRMSLHSVAARWVPGRELLEAETTTLNPGVRVAETSRHV